MKRKAATPARRSSAKAATSDRFVPPYPASWLDRLTQTVDRIPGPYWWPYLAAGLAAIGLAAVLFSLDGQGLTAAVVFAHSVPYYGFWLLHYLDRRAAASLEEYRPAFTGNAAELRDVRYRLTTLPARPATVVTLVALLITWSVSTTWETGSLSALLDRAQFYLADVFAGLYLYHSVRQLRLVNRLYAASTQVDLNNLAPLHAFSTLSAHTAAGGLLIISGGVLITPTGFVGPFLIAGIVFALMAVLAFVLPLMGLNRRLVRAKTQALSENDRRWQALMDEVYRRLDRGDLAAADKVNTTLSALERARAVIERIPTWPWRPEALRSLLAALVLPVVISLIQVFLRRLFE